MISSISSSSYMPPQPPAPRESESLTSEQQATISEVLSQYDSENLTADDATAIVESFAEAGIQPSEALATEMTNAGFDMATIGDLAGAGGPGGMGGPPPPPPPSGEANGVSSEELSSMVEYLDSALEDGSLDISSDTRMEDMLALLSEKFGITEDTNLVDVSA